MTMCTRLSLALRFCAVGLVFGLAGCSSEPTGQAPDQLLAQVTESLFSSGNREASEVRDISELTRAAIADVTIPLILFELPDQGVATTLKVWYQDGAFIYWRSADGGSLILDDGVIFATRGIGWDLMAAETRQTAALVRQGRGAEYSRSYRHLDGLNQMIVRDMTCRFQRAGSETIVVLERRHAVTRFEESCQDGTLAFTNLYWAGSDGFLWKSRQWIGEKLGSATIQRLIR
ncbi:YjbF family lipoprotein [Meridianimarinicoccus sp. MJW13]|uniref:YjbF family lipoprotein n=1 Tax=Meridianimarinicoccus sp. MJW13 TaxID=2720031 RepID=UPI001868588B|nr:YjbF family lipoprotein [Fluviibacterium sp. MJW13]